MAQGGDKARRAAKAELREQQLEHERQRVARRAAGYPKQEVEEAPKKTSRKKKKSSKKSS